MKASHLRARYWRIVYFFGRVALGFMFWEVLLPKLGLARVSQRTRSERYGAAARRFRALAIRMTGLMIKVGQFLSARLDVLPREITDELSDLQDEVPPEAFSDIRAKAEADLGQTLGAHYAWVDPEPMAAASLGQVHRARLRDNDADEQGFRDVVVKVQRPHIEQVVDTDLAALRRVAGWLQRYRPVAEHVDVPALIEEFASTTLQEIDYLAEGSNAERFAENFTGDPGVRVPRVVWELTTRHVLTLEDVSAIKITDYDAITEAGIDRAEVAARLLDTYMRQILEDGFFHADPHPGNLFVAPLTPPERDDDSEARPAGAERPATDARRPEWVLTFVDFGMVGTVPEHLRAGLREAMIAIGTQDGSRLVEAFKTLGVLLPTADLRLIELASMQLFDRFGGMSMADLRGIDHAEMMSFGLQFRELMVDLPFQLPEDLLLLGRSLAILNGMCSGLDPEFNLWTALAPYANKLIAEEGTTAFQTFLDEAQKVLKVAVGLPGRADRVLTLMERGELNVQTPLLELRIRRLERTVGRISGGIVFAGMLVAGAVLNATDPGLARWLMGGSLLPLAWVLFAGRGRRHRL